MKIWVVDTKVENTCAWTKKEDAINYLKKEAKVNEWELFHNINENLNNDNDDILHFFARYAKEEPWEIIIYSMFLDEVPYLL